MTEQHEDDWIVEALMDKVAQSIKTMSFEGEARVKLPIPVSPEDYIAIRKSAHPLLRNMCQVEPGQIIFGLATIVLADSAPPLARQVASKKRHGN